MHSQTHLVRLLLVPIALCLLDLQQMTNLPSAQKVSETDTFLRNALQASLKKYVHYNRLEYGASCSPPTEKPVSSLWSHYAAHLTSADPTVARSEGFHLLKDLADLINAKTSLCNYYRKLSCDPITSTCHCLQGHFMGIEARTVREGGACFLQAGSYCTPPNLHDLSIKDASRCEGGSSCVIAQSPSLNCTRGNIYKISPRQNPAAAAAGLTPAEVKLDSAPNFGRRFGEALRNGLCICSHANTLTIFPPSLGVLLHLIVYGICLVFWKK